jgi:hypothetical protein
MRILGWTCLPRAAGYRRREPRSPPLVAVLTLSAAWATDYPTGAARSAGRSGYAFVANHAAGGANPRLASRGQHATSGTVRGRDVLRCAMLAATGPATTPSTLFRTLLLMTDPLRRGTAGDPRCVPRRCRRLALVCLTDRTWYRGGNSPFVTSMRILGDMDTVAKCHQVRSPGAVEIGVAKTGDILFDHYFQVPSAYQR